MTEPTPGTPVWWALRPLWLLVPAAVLVPLVALFARFERPAPTLWTTARSRRRGALVATVLGLVAVVLGVLGVAVSGIWPLFVVGGDLLGLRMSPGIGLLSLGAGILLLGRGRLGR